MKEPTKTLIPERLITIRKRLNLSKAEAARQTGLTAASYVRYESGDRSPSPQVLTSIAEKLGTSVAYLSGDTDDISPNVISIYKSDSPQLFELLKDIQKADNSTIKRLLSYYRKLTSK